MSMIKMKKASSRKKMDRTHGVVAGLVKVVLAVVVHPDESDSHRVFPQSIEAGPCVRTAAAEYVSDV